MDAIERLDRRFDAATEPLIQVLKASYEGENGDLGHHARHMANPVSPAQKLGLILYFIALGLSINHFLPSVSNSYHFISHELFDFHKPYTEERLSESFLIGIFSEGNQEGFEHRQALRKYYQKHKNPRVCSLRDYLEQEMKVKMNSAGRSCNVAYTFVIGSADGDHARPLPNSNHRYSNYERDCTYLDADDDTDEKGQAFLKYAASLPKSLDNLVRMEDSSFFASQIHSFSDWWSPSSKANTKRTINNSIKLHLMEFVDGDHPPSAGNRLIYGSPGVPTRPKNIFARHQFHFMTMELVELIAEKLHMVPSPGGGDSISDCIISHLQPKNILQSEGMLRPQKYKRVEPKL